MKYIIQLLIFVIYDKILELQRMYLHDHKMINIYFIIYVECAFIIFSKDIVEYMVKYIGNIENKGYDNINRKPLINKKMNDIILIKKIAYLIIYNITFIFS